MQPMESWLRRRNVHCIPWRSPGTRPFRDKTSLSANPALWPAIEQALGESGWFLYMASPQAAQSIRVRNPGTEGASVVG